MNKLDTSQIADPGKQQPLLGPSVEFIQNATKESLAGVAQAFIGDAYSTSVGYALNGVLPSGTNTITLGYIYFNGEIYFFSGLNGYSSFANVGVFVALNINGPADPITFTDSTQGNVHNVRRLQLVDQVNGSGLFNFSNLIYLQPTKVIVGGASPAPAYQNSFTAGISLVFRRNLNKLVTIQGMAIKTTTSTVANQVIFTLPSGYRPAAARNLIGMIFYDTTTLVVDFLNISTNGDVSISGVNAPGSISSGVNVYFSNVSFYAD